MGPTESIDAEGRYEERDLVWAHRRQILLPAVFWCVVRLVFQSGLIWLVFRPSIWIALAVGAGLSIWGFVAQMTWASAAQVRKLMQQTPALSGVYRMSFGDNGIVTTVTLPTREVSHVWFGWSRVREVVRRSNDFAILLDTGGSLIVPRRFLSREESWSRLADLIATVSSGNHPEIAAIPLINRPTSMPVVSGEVVLMWRDMAEALLTQPTSASRWTLRAIWALIGASAVFVAVMCAIVWWNTRMMWLVLVMLGVVVGTIVLGVLLFRVGRYVARAWWWFWLRKNALLGQVMTVELFTSGIAISAPGVVSMTPWGNYTGYRVERDWLALNAGPHQPLVLPRRCFNDGQWVDLIQLIHRNVGTCGCGYLLRGATAEACPECGAAVAAPQG